MQNKGQQNISSTQRRSAIIFHAVLRLYQELSTCCFVFSQSRENVEEGKVEDIFKNIYLKKTFYNSDSIKVKKFKVKMFNIRFVSLLI